MASAVELDIAGRRVRLSNPDQVYYPARGFTKLDVAQYYPAVADGVLRGLRDRQPGTGFAEAVRAGYELRALLGEYGLRGWPKTSGGRGVHVYVPLEPRWTFTEARRALIALGRELERRMPERITVAWWKEQRGEKIFVDYN